jgi:hypothetical protein
MGNENIKTALDLLRIREARGLQVPVIVRILFSFYGLISAYTSPIPQRSRLIIMSIAIPYIAVNIC